MAKELRSHVPEPAHDLVHEIYQASRNSHISRIVLRGITSRASRWEFCWDALAPRCRNGDTLSESIAQQELEDPQSNIEGVPFRTEVYKLIYESFSDCTGKNILLSCAGVAGRCVLGILPGDEIVCLFGLSMPLILRPRNGH